MVILDALSRRPDHNDGKADNEDIIMILDNAFTRCTQQDEYVDETGGYITMFPHYLLARAINAPLLEAIRREHKCNPIVLEAIQALQGNRPAPAQTSLNDWQTDSALIWYQEHVYVPMNRNLCQQVVTLYHELPSAGHPGISKTNALVQHNFWWPGMGQFIA